jgi:hypothetical protein
MTRGYLRRSSATGLRRIPKPWAGCSIHPGGTTFPRRIRRGIVVAVGSSGATFDLAKSGSGQARGSRKSGFLSRDEVLLPRRSRLEARAPIGSVSGTASSPPGAPAGSRAGDVRGRPEDPLVKPAPSPAASDLAGPLTAAYCGAAASMETTLAGPSEARTRSASMPRPSGERSGRWSSRPIRTASTAAPWRAMSTI